mmetsp:Transcript_11475/g.24885  ORF Transcript_11475/g.24885 Transcript_11475/m.24885 type:complete len:138 (+) Transcript_11475:446-859(+)
MGLFKGGNVGAAMMNTFVRPWTHITFKLNDINGFVQLFFDNASTVLILVNLLLNTFWIAPKEAPAGVAAVVQQEANHIVWGRVIPGLAITMIFGNVYYAWMACYYYDFWERLLCVDGLPGIVPNQTVRGCYCAAVWY